MTYGDHRQRLQVRTLFLDDLRRPQTKVTGSYLIPRWLTATIDKGKGSYLIPRWLTATIGKGYMLVPYYWKTYGDHRQRQRFGLYYWMTYGDHRHRLQVRIVLLDDLRRPPYPHPYHLIVKGYMFVPYYLMTYGDLRADQGRTDAFRVSHPAPCSLRR